MALTQKIVQLKGDFYLRNLTTGETALTPMFNGTSGALTPSVTTEKVPSNGNTRGTVYTYETDRALSLSITLQSRHSANLSNFLLGTMVEQPAGVDVAFAVPALKAGQAVHLGAGNVTSVTIPGYTLDVDFEVRSSGAVVAINDMTAVATGAVFSHDAYAEHGIFNAEAQSFEIVYVSEYSNSSYVLYKGLLVPSGDLTLLAESGVGTAQVTFELSESATAPDSAILGKYGRVYNG